MAREAVDLSESVDGDGKLRRQVSSDEFPNDLDHCIISLAVSPELHCHGAVVENRGAGTGRVGPAQAGPIFAFTSILNLLSEWSFFVEMIQLLTTLFESLSQ